jgi:hypothetical protein
MRRCVYRKQLDLETLVCTRGPAPYDLSCAPQWSEKRFEPIIEPIMEKDYRYAN